MSAPRHERPIRLGTRRSHLAVTQSTHVADALRAYGMTLGPAGPSA